MYLCVCVILLCVIPLVVTHLLKPLSVFIAHDEGKLPISALITRAHKQNIKRAENSQQTAPSQYEMNVTYSCREVMYSSSTEETKGSVKTPALSLQCVCEILSALVCACQAAVPSIWITLMKGERGNNQRSQYFTLDTDACWCAAGRRISPRRSARLWSDIKIQRYISLSGSLTFSLIPIGAPASSPHLCPSTQLQLKGKCSSGEVCNLHHKVPEPTMWPGPPNILLFSLSSSSFALFSAAHLFIAVHLSGLIRRGWWNGRRTAILSPTKHGAVQKIRCFATQHCWQCKRIIVAFFDTQTQNCFEIE